QRKEEVGRPGGDSGRREGGEGERRVDREEDSRSRPAVRPHHLDGDHSRRAEPCRWNGGGQPIRREDLGGEVETVEAEDRARYEAGAVRREREIGAAGEDRAGREGEQREAARL